ncbi:MAG: chemotaxis protein CheB [Candidatus Neomarinimicrobiota bacterium]
MALIPTTNLQQFQDPLLGWLAQMVRNGSRPGAKYQLLLDLAEAIRSARTGVNPMVQILNTADPILQAVQRTIARHNFRFVWKKILVIGCSAGGEVALRTLFRQIKFPHLPMIIAMHHNPGFQFSTRFELANQVSQRFEPAGNGQLIDGSRVYFLPSRVLHEFSVGQAAFLQQPLTERPRFRPEIDKVMSSTARRFNSTAVGIILSGMLDDGAEGSKAMAAAGSEVWVQEPGSALFKEMPKAALRATTRATSLSLAAMGQRINNLSFNHLTLEPLAS